MHSRADIPRGDKTMNRPSIKRKAVLLYRIGLGICAVATALGTLAAMNGNWISWAVNCAIFLVAGWCVFINVGLARRHP